MSSSTASNCALCHNQRRARRDETSKEKVSITPLGSPLPLGEGEGTAVNRRNAACRKSARSITHRFSGNFHFDDGCSKAERRRQFTF